MATFIPEMRIYDDEGQRLYLTAFERDSFLKAADQIDQVKRMYCYTLHYTGCRPSEVLEISPARIDLDQKHIVVRTLKKRSLIIRGESENPNLEKSPLRRI